MPEPPRVGVGMVVTHRGRLLLCRRLARGGRPATWSPPGGWLEPGEDFAGAALRETEEETGLRVPSAAFLAVSNDVFDDGRHCVTVWMTGEAPHDAAELRAPEEHDRMGWFAPDELPRPLFLCFERLLRGQGHPPLPAWLGTGLGF